MREPDAQLEHALADAFPTADLRRYDPVGDADAIEYEVRLPLPTSFTEARVSLGAMRRGLSTLMARFEPLRFNTVAPLMETFGERETLSAIRAREVSPQSVVLAPPPEGSQVVH